MAKPACCLWPRHARRRAVNLPWPPRKNPRSAKLDAARAASETVEVIARKFIERHVKPNTRRSYETTRIIERDILPVWGKRPISIIIRRDVAVLLDTVVDRGSPVMANRVFAVGRKMFFGRLSAA